MSAINFGAVVGNGAGQTIAIVDPFNDPNIASDLQSFDAYFNIANPPSFRVVNENGGTALPGVDPTGAWEAEEAMNVEWAHALAPNASIILVEASTANAIDMIGGGVNWARQQPGVTVVSVGYDAPGEFAGETAYDSVFTTPAGHVGVTFVAPTGDTGSPGGYASLSPNVLGVGGTSLTLNSGNYASETVWNNTYGKSGGGLSTIESRPDYQNGVADVVGTQRGAPDVAFDADPLTGVDVYDTYNGAVAAPWTERGGTNLGAPAWAAIIAVADQGRALVGLGSLDGATETLPMLYSLPSRDFHDVKTGNNGAYTAGPGYDLATGLGTPVVNLLVQDLIIPPTDDAQYLRGVYTDATGGLTAAGGYDAALAQLDAARASVLATYANSYVLSLGRPQLVQDLYSSTGGSVIGIGNLIDRALSPGEASYWAAQLQSGMSYEQMIVQLTASTTYFAETAAGHDVNGSDAAFVNQIYNDLLHRNPNSYEENSLFVPQLNAAEYLARQQDVNRLLAGASPASFNGSVDSLYLRFLGRHAAQGELNYWASVFGANPTFTNVNLVEALLASGEFYVRNNPTAPLPTMDAKFADNLYTAVFGAPNKTAEQTIDLPFLTNAEIMARTAVAQAIVGSAEFHNDVTTAVYQHLLNRLPSTYELAEWQTVVGKGATQAGGANGDEQLLAAVFSSNEYFMDQKDAVTHLSTNDSWLKSLYPNLRVAFNATAESTQLANVLAAYAPARQAVVNAVISSPEYLTQVVQTVYTTYMGRPAGVGDVAIGLNHLQNGGTPEQLIAAILGSGEYFSREAPIVVGGGATAGNATLIRAMYKQLFPGYTVSQGEVTYWTNQLSAGTITAAQIAANLDTTGLYRFGTTGTPAVPSSYNGSVDRAYMQYMGRHAGPTEITYWASVYAANPNYSDADLIKAILNSEEYFLRTRTFA
jgi:hypothetical protein